MDSRFYSNHKNEHNIRNKSDKYNSGSNEKYLNKKRERYDNYKHYDNRIILSKNNYEKRGNENYFFSLRNSKYDNKKLDYEISKKDFKINSKKEQHKDIYNNYDKKNKYYENKEKYNYSFHSRRYSISNLRSHSKNKNKRKKKDDYKKYDIKQSNRGSDKSYSKIRKKSINSDNIKLNEREEYKNQYYSDKKNLFKIT